MKIMFNIVWVLCLIMVIALAFMQGYSWGTKHGYRDAIQFYSQTENKGR
jgi:hypothetical protein